jgi:hypothetical protein
VTSARAERLLEVAGVGDEHLVLFVDGGEALAGAFLGAHRLRIDRCRKSPPGPGLHVIETSEERRAAVSRLFEGAWPGAMEGRILADPPERFPAVVSGGFDRAILVADELDPEAAARRVLCVYFLLGPGGRLVASLDASSLDGDGPLPDRGRLARWAELNGADVSCPEGRDSRARALVVDR